MKVLHVIPSVSVRSGGPAQAIFPMCRSLSAIGIETLLATTTDGVAVKKNQLGNPQNYRQVSTLFFPAQLGHSFKFSRPMSIWLNASVPDFTVVHIHAVFNHACIAAAATCRKYGVPYVVRPLGTLDPWGMRQKRLIKSAFWLLSGKKMLRSAAAVHYTTEAEKRATEDALGLNHGTVIPLGINLDPSQTELDNYPLLPKPPNEKYVLVLSRLDPKKGLEILIDAFLSVVRGPEFSDWRLVLAGDGKKEYVRHLKTKAASTNGSARILFPGWLDGDAKKLFLRQASLLALPSFRENFGLCVLEAMAVGVPVIISPHVNLSEAVTSARAGWIAAVETQSLSGILREAFASETERVKRGLAGRNLSMRFTWPVVAQQLKNLYSRIQHHA